MNQESRKTGTQQRPKFDQCDVGDFVRDGDDMRIPTAEQRIKVPIEKNNRENYTPAAKSGRMAEWDTPRFDEHMEFERASHYAPNGERFDIWKRVAAVVILCALCVSSSFARIGETEAQIEKRYGAPVEATTPQPDRKVYKFKGFTINVRFVDGKSVLELIWKSEETSMDPSVVKGLLDANAPAGTTWRPAGEKDSWKRSDGKAIAQLTFGSLAIEAVTKRDLDLAKKLVEESEAEKTKGF